MACASVHRLLQRSQRDVVQALALRVTHYTLRIAFTPLSGSSSCPSLRPARKHISGRLAR